MSSAFFEKIQWDSIYERRQDGPWVPELPSFMVGRRGSNVRSTVSTKESLSEQGSDRTSGLLVFTPPPFHRMTAPEEPSKSPVNNTATTRKTTQMKSSPIRETECNDEEDGEEDEEDGDYESDGEELAVRDSVFVFSTNAHNQLPDWSFIDDAVLQSYSTQDNNNNAKNMKKKKFNFPKKTSKTEDGASSPNGDIQVGETETATTLSSEVPTSDNVTADNNATTSANLETPERA